MLGFASLVPLGVDPRTLRFQSATAVAIAQTFARLSCGVLRDWPCWESNPGSRAPMEHCAVFRVLELFILRYWRSMESSLASPIAWIVEGSIRGDLRIWRRWESNPGPHASEAPPL